ncbi:DMT family transporter [Cohnella silvisoli]|uniref:DMT family transporter n=1 Tax=Cohnella silvisoli TaxID=2873699 RepID=A0ABV1L0P4_9BACL|nr:DMT family transporter [Cohnella silvisoli]MCD9025353.1 DMT family transporter [Cohnella silvisoli]
MLEQRKLYLLALLYAFVIGFSFLFTKLALDFADPIDTLAYRFTLSFVAIVIPVLAGWIKLDLSFRKWLRLLPIGLVYPTLFFGFQAFGLAHATSSVGGILSASSPIFTLIMASLVLKERTTWIQKLSVLCSVGGVVYIIAMGGASAQGTSALGIFMLLLSALLMSLYGVLARYLRDGYTAIQMSYVMMLIGCVSFNAMSVAKHTLNGTMPSLFEPLTHPHFIISIVYIGLMSSLVSSFLSNYVLSKLEATRMSVFVNLGNLISIVAGVIFLNEKLSYYHIVGAVLIIGGVLGVNYRKRTKIKYVMEVKTG